MNLGMTTSSTLDVDLQLLYPDSELPAYATDGSGGLDFFAHSMKNVGKPEGIMIGLGIAMAIPKDWSLLLLSRSGHGIKYGIRLANCVGLIDSDYRGEIFVKLKDDGWLGKNPDISVPVQGIFVHTPRVNMRIVDTLPPTARGANGFGHSDALRST